jgi:bifunctional UDP-N-acetylglucosamine pyrophosphorylase/glucosamine-1-phosphate N-acetyltransferase
MPNTTQDHWKNPLEIIVLAAGQGTRMRSSIPKVLHRIAHHSLLEHVCSVAAALEPEQVTVIYGHGGELVRESLGHLQVSWVEQREQLGTGHAVMQVADQIGEENTILILYGDVPLLRAETVRRLIPLVQDQTLGLLTVELLNPRGYGRIVRNQRGKVQRIVEEKDATPEERTIFEVNTGILCVQGRHLKKWLSKLENHNAQSEYYLTDIISMAVNEGIEIKTTHPGDSDEVLGVNNREQLAHLERAYQKRQAEQLMLAGVTLRDPARFDLRGVIESIGMDVEIDVNVLLEGRVRIGERVKIGHNVTIRDSEIADDVEILPNCVIDQAVIGRGCRIGPYARIRPETQIEEEVHIGNFVEIKKSSIACRSKINHLSYVGDTVVGRDVNIGAGTITCNYDGANKHQTIIEDGAFIGSDTQLVAPVRVGKNATIGAGSTITRNTPDNALTLSRVEQKSIEGWQRPIKRK